MSDTAAKCPMCTGPVRVVGDSAEGTMHYEMFSVVRDGTALAALKAEMVAKGRHGMLTDVIGWLTDQAEADDIDGAEWDAEFCRKLAQSLAERFA